MSTTPTSRPNGALRPPMAAPVQQTLLTNAALRTRMVVTPEQAEAWLLGNTRNRKLRETVALRYASDMESGNWKYNYTAILIASDGTVIDGQHRLTACALAKVPFETDVVFNADPTVQPYLDNNEVRSAADQVAMAGIKNSSRACAAAALLLTHQRFGIEKVTSPTAKPSRIAVERFVHENDAKLQAAIQTNSVSTLCAPRVIDFCNYLFREQDPVMAERFMSELAGDQPSQTSPAFHLRERLQNNWRAKAKLPLKELIALFFKAWIAYRDGKAVRCLKWNSGAEPFPQI